MEIQGHSLQSFAPVVEAFTENFTATGERGAACVIYHRGELVVDIYAGSRGRDDKLPWQRNILVTIFSVGKPLLACAVL